MEARCYSEMSTDFQRATQLYIPEDISLYNRRFGNLRYLIFFFLVPSLLRHLDLIIGLWLGEGWQREYEVWAWSLHLQNNGQAEPYKKTQ
jgi:hypothetical protein